MHRRIPAILSLFVLLPWIAVPDVPARRRAGNRLADRNRPPPFQEKQQVLAGSPLRFEPNVGQAPADVRYIGRGGGNAVLITDHEAVMVLGQDRVRMKITGALSTVVSHPEGRLKSITTYYLGDDPAKWRQNVANFSRVKFEDVYAGIDLVYYGNQRRLEYDFVVHPGANPEQIKLAYSGADSMRVASNGDLVLKVGGDELRMLKPVVYQEIAGKRVIIDGRYELASNEVHFALGKYDREKTLVVDPGVAYATYLGGSGFDVGNGIAVDGSGAAYVTGYTSSGNFPTLNAEQPTIGSPSDDAVVAKFDATGALVYSTYLGGAADDFGFGIAVDGTGAVYVVGSTGGSFPILNASQSAFGGGSTDLFVTKLNPSGALAYSTYVGGAGDDTATGIAVDGQGAIYGCGYSNGSFPLLNAAQVTYGGGSEDAIVFKLGPTGTRVYSTYIGGPNEDISNQIAVDASGTAYVTGVTTGAFPTLNASQNTFGGGSTDAFAAKISPSGAFVYETYIGGSSDDYGLGIATDGTGAAYVAGYTSGPFPTLNAAQSIYGGGVSDAFVTKLDTNGLVAYSTYLGGSGGDAADSIAVDSTGNVFLSGNTTGSFPIVNAIQGTPGGSGRSAFIAQLSPSGAVAYATYLGGASDSNSTAVATDGAGSAYAAGYTGSGFPVIHAQQTNFGGNANDFFIAKLLPATPVTLLSLSPNSAPEATPILTFTINGTGFYPGPLVLFQGTQAATHFVSPTKITVSLNSSFFNTAGSQTVQFDKSNVLKFSVVSPSITSISPAASPVAPLIAVPLTVTGTNFVATSTVHFNASTLTTNFVDANHLTATIPTSLLAAAGTASVSVVNAVNPSNSASFVIGTPTLICTANTVLPSQVRFEADADLLGDAVLTCTGGVAGQVVTTDISFAPGLNLTSRILNNATQLTEALALVNDPAAAQQVLNTNVFQGTLASPGVITFKGVKLTAPGVSGSTTVRLTNLRANIFQLGQTSFPAGIVASIFATGGLALNNSQVASAFVTGPMAVKLGEVSSVADQRSFPVTFSEPFASAFKLRVAAGGQQNLPGVLNNTESGFVNTTLLPTAGLADSATRLLLRISNLPGGAKAYASVFPDTNTNAQLIATDANGAGATSLITGSNLFGGKYSQVTLDNSGTGVAVWEVTSVNPNSFESFPFHIVLTGMTQPDLGNVSFQGGFAPLSNVAIGSSTDPVPRFAADYLTGFVNLVLSSNSIATTGITTQSLPGHTSTDLRRAIHTQDTLPQVQVGSNLGFTYNVVNNGPGPANQVTVSTNLPSSLSYLSCSTSTGGICAATSNTDGSTTVTSEFSAKVQPGQSAFFDVQATAASESASVPVTAVLSNRVPESVPADNILITNFGISSTKPPAVTVNFNSVPSGLVLQPASVSVDQATPITFSTPTPQADGAVTGKQYAFKSWTDGSTNATHPPAIPPLGGGTITATFDTQYRLTLTPSPAAGGTVATSLVSAGGYYNTGSDLQITATPAAGFTFTGFSGDVTTTDGNPVLNFVIPQKVSNIQANFVSASLGLSPTALFFGSTPGASVVTSQQTINVSAPRGASWTVSANQPFISVAPTSGTGTGTFNVSMVTSKLPATGSATGIVTVTSTAVGNSPQTLNISAVIGASTKPFGSFDTPADGTTGVSGAIAVTGWALDSIEVSNVDIWREPVGSEPVAGNGLVFIGNTVFVVGARPDVQAANPTTPFDYRAGWGYLLLTTGLPGATPGNGTYKLHAIAHNKAGAAVDLGTKSITVDNAHSTKPFGTIDTPDQGGTISGTQFINFGWALAQNPNCVPTDGSTVTVTVDSVTLGHATYNQARSDLASAFPGRCNSAGAAGYFFIDTTLLANGVHTIGWLAYDNKGNGDGLGSRFFNVLNTSSPAAPEEPAQTAASSDVKLRRGYDQNRKTEKLTPGSDGVYAIDIEELDRMELDAGITTGHLMTADGEQPLPTGSTIKGGVFYWQLAPGFLGRYDLSFRLANDDRLRVRVTVRPKRYSK